ncbi:MAG: DUF1624 domain-containing protein [Acidobacteria bacterium]|nr:DUF1624 domain-containing protein [Acidobacteriota bacterium]
MGTASRYAAIDAWRGLIMILMAIDHASAFIARQHASEFWAGAMSAYTDWFPFLTRAVTHLCAPGFFFLMGAGVLWSGAAPAGIARRGLAIFVAAQLFEAPVFFLQGFLKAPPVSLNTVTGPPPNDGTAFYWGFATLTGLALVMLACAVLVRLKPWMWAVTAVVCVAATHGLLPADGKPQGWWAVLLLTPGFADHIVSVYPVIPWLGVAAAGMCFAWWWRRDPHKASRRVWMVGAGMVLAGCAVRFAGGWGNIRLPRDGGWIEFLNNVKYPPSLVFWMLAVGMGLLVTAGLARMAAVLRDDSPLIVFGQTPLFFYLTHFAVLCGAAFALYREPATLAGIYPVWAVTIVVLYPACRWYREFKQSRPAGSVWRLL